MRRTLVLVSILSLTVVLGCAQDERSSPYGERILAAAEKIFSDRGYDGTSIKRIADAAGVNKALIYYHFRNKQDLIDSLFARTIDDMFGMLGTADEQIAQSLHGTGAEERLDDMVGFLEKRKKILSVMLMEALKNDTSGHVSLFRCADMVIARNVDEMLRLFEAKGGQGVSREELLIHEFFTGFLPVVCFAIFRNKWADFFHCDRRAMNGLFAKVFTASHIRHDWRSR